MGSQYSVHLHIRIIITDYPLLTFLIITYIKLVHVCVVTDYSIPSKDNFFSKKMSKKCEVLYDVVVYH